jgi:hypothetical protein
MSLDPLALPYTPIAEYATSVALTAYAGTGKDTLIREIQRQELRLDSLGGLGKKTRWMVYGRTASATHDLKKLYSLMDRKRYVMRFAFADALKNEVHRRLGFKDCPTDTFEHVKNTLLACDPSEQPPQHKTIRQHYIDHGQARRAEDPLAWAKIISHEIEGKTNGYGVDYTIVDIISDYRFRGELMSRHYPDFDQKADDVVTIRLFRASVKPAPRLADPSKDSEHNLDGETTTLIFVPPGEFPEALAAFPQYSAHVPIAVINPPSW